MEDVKELVFVVFTAVKIQGVSILVLMEDVKERGVVKCYGLLTYVSFNPCFNGRCKRTLILVQLKNNRICVSILVLMEDVKELCQIFGNATVNIVVSILVLMEDVKEPTNQAAAGTSQMTFQSLF